MSNSVYLPNILNKLDKNTISKWLYIIWRYNKNVQHKNDNISSGVHGSQEKFSTNVFLELIIPMALDSQVETVFPHISREQQYFLIISSFAISNLFFSKRIKFLAMKNDVKKVRIENKFIFHLNRCHKVEEPCSCIANIG